MAGGKLCDIGKMIDIEIVDTKGGGKGGQISGRIIEHAGKQTGAPVKTGIAGKVDISRVEFHVIEYWNHGAKNAEKNPGDFDEGSPIEFIRLKDASRSEKI